MTRDYDWGSGLSFNADFFLLAASEPEEEWEPPINTRSGKHD